VGNQEGQQPFRDAVFASPTMQLEVIDPTTVNIRSHGSKDPACDGPADDPFSDLFTGVPINASEDFTVSISGVTPVNRVGQARMSIFDDPSALDRQRVHPGRETPAWTGEIAAARLITPQALR
jgi:hypothetical protein